MACTVEYDALGYPSVFYLYRSFFLVSILPFRPVVVYIRFLISMAQKTFIGSGPRRSSRAPSWLAVSNFEYSVGVLLVRIALAFQFFVYLFLLDNLLC